MGDMEVHSGELADLIWEWWNEWFESGRAKPVFVKNLVKAVERQKGIKFSYKTGVWTKKGKVVR